MLNYTWCVDTGVVVSEDKAAGHTLLTQLLQSSPLLKTVLSILNTGLQELLQYNLTSPGMRTFPALVLLNADWTVFGDCKTCTHVE